MRNDPWVNLDDAAIETRTEAILHAAGVTSDARDVSGAVASMHVGRQASRVTPSTSAAPRWRRAVMTATTVGAALLLAVAGIALIRGTGERQRGVDAGTPYTTRTGQHATITLADGSRVTLAPRTTLRVSQGFGTRERSVSLDGEAYFDVRPNPSAPFVVHSRGVRTRVLGTTFTVRSDGPDSAVRVTVITGKVAVTAPASGQTTTLTAGMAGQVGDSATAVARVADPANAAAWTRGYLVFERAPAREVLSALTRWYGTSFRIADSTLATETVTAWISTQSRSEALATLKLVLNVELTFDDSVITLRPRRASREHRPAPRQASPFPSPSVSEVGR